MRTFAYFSVQTQGTTSNTTITAQTSKVGTLTMSSGNSLYLGITAAEMAQELSSDTEVSYWSTTTPNSGTPITSNNLKVQSDQTVSNVKLTGGDTGTKYHCTAQYEITISGIDEPSKSSIVEGDGKIHLSTVTSGDKIKALISNTADGASGVTSTSHTLQSILNPDRDSNKFYVVYDFESTSAINTDNGDTADLKASLEIVNTKENQNYLADKSITVTIKTVDDSGLNCNYTQPES